MFFNSTQFSFSATLSPPPQAACLLPLAPLEAGVWSRPGQRGLAQPPQPRPGASRILPSTAPLPWGGSDGECQRPAHGHGGRREGCGRDLLALRRCAAGRRWWWRRLLRAGHQAAEARTHAALPCAQLVSRGRFRQPHSGILPEPRAAPLRFCLQEVAGLCHRSVASRRKENDKEKASPGFQWLPATAPRTHEVVWREEGEISVVGQRQVIFTSFNSPSERKTQTTAGPLFLFFKLRAVWSIFPFSLWKPMAPFIYLLFSSCSFLFLFWIIISKVRSGVCLPQFWCCQSQVCFSIMQWFILFILLVIIIILFCFCFLAGGGVVLVHWSISTSILLRLPLEMKETAVIDSFRCCHPFLFLIPWLNWNRLKCCVLLPCVSATVHRHEQNILTFRHSQELVSTISWHFWRK